MSVAATIDPKKIRRLSAPETADPAGLAEYARLAERWAHKVQRRWPELPSEVREVLTAFAYYVSEPPQGVVGQWRRFSGRIRLAYVLLRGQEEVLREFLNAVDHLVNAVLTAIERENPQYEEDLKDAVLEAFVQTGGRRMTAEEAGEWTRDIFNRTVE